MAEDKGVKNIDEVVNFINEYMKVKSFDNISAFLDEVVLFEDISLAQLAKDMNISTKEIKEKNENEEEFYILNHDFISNDSHMQDV